MDIAHSIRARRLELGMSQEDLANALRYKSRSSIAKIESGDADIPLSKLSEIAQALDTSIVQLLGGFSRSELGSRRMLRPGGADNRRVAALVLAGGKSSRNLQNIPNQYASVLGKPVIAYCLDVYQRHPLVDDVYIVCSEEWEGIVSTYASSFGIDKMCTTVRAGSSGVRSIRNGLKRLLTDGYRPDDLVVLQEATRPFVTEEMVSAVLAAAAKDGSAIIGEHMHDSVQFYVTNEETSYIERDNIVSLQSPDAYTLDFIEEVFDRADRDGVAQCQSCMGLLMDDLGYRLNFCSDVRGNMKIIRAEDLAVFAALLKQRA